MLTRLGHGPSLEGTSQKASSNLPLAHLPPKTIPPRAGGTSAMVSFFKGFPGGRLDHGPSRETARAIPAGYSGDPGKRCALTVR